MQGNLTWVEQPASMGYLDTIYPPTSFCAWACFQYFLHVGVCMWYIPFSFLYFLMIFVFMSGAREPCMWMSDACQLVFFWFLLQFSSEGQ